MMDLGKWEIFMIGAFCGAYVMLTLMGCLWASKRAEPTGNTAGTDGNEPE